MSPALSPALQPVAARKPLSPVRASETEKYIMDAIAWESDKELRRAKSERRAWMVAAAAVLIALLALIALALLVPLKSTVPYLVSVDRQTGNTEVVSAVNERSIGYQELNDKYWTKRYVVARESYMYTLLQYDYDTVLRLSSDEVGRGYVQVFNGDNAKDKRLGASTEERIKVISVVLPPGETGKAVVRFEKSTFRQNADRPDAPVPYVATLAYEFKPSMKGKEADLYENPLGFKVSSYRVDAELQSGNPK